MDANTLQGIIKERLKDFLPKESNKVVWALCQELSSGYNRDLKNQVSVVKDELAKDKRTKAKKLTDEERADALTGFLDGKLLDGSLTAAELAQFKDIYGLKAKDKDVTLQLVDFKDALPESYAKMKLVERMIIAEIYGVNDEG